jgi:16S rRNA (cytosine967-C5)-methyltransferase
MTPAGRLAAAIEVLAEVEARHRPVRLALKAWGDGARYAGSKDRAFVSGLVLDALRKRRSLAWRMGDDSARASVLGVPAFEWGWNLDELAAAAAGEPHGPGALTEAEAAALASPRPLEEAPPPVRGDYPDWLDGSLQRAFGERRAEEGAALARRAPVDLRANRLKGDAERALRVLAPFGAGPSSVLTEALRIPAPLAAERAAPVESEPEFAKGWFEVQDLGSQIAAAAAGSVKNLQVLDLCAGGGGKTLALAAAMGSTGQIYAYDSDSKRLSEVVTRSQRAGVRNLQTRSPKKPGALDDLAGRMDLVFLDAPCTGSGVWRRHPDAKWRLTPEQLERRIADQKAVLAEARRMAKAGGRIVYVTCSLLAEENEDQIAAFLAEASEFHAISALEAVQASGLATPAGLGMLGQRLTPGGFLRLSPGSAGTDGFFVAVLEKAAA